MILACDGNVFRFPLKFCYEIFVISLISFLADIVNCFSHYDFVLREFIYIFVSFHLAVKIKNSFSFVIMSASCLL